VGKLIDADKFCEVLDESLTKAMEISIGQGNFSPANFGCLSSAVLAIKKLANEMPEIETAVDNADQRWISTSEKLPPLGEDVFVHYTGSIGISALMSVDDDGPYWSYSGIGGDPDFWMPLPALPEGMQ
jgi:hypothetical protein